MDYEPPPRWDCIHQWANVGLPVKTWYSNNTSSAPPPNCQAYQKQRCLYCGGVRQIIVGDDDGQE